MVAAVEENTLFALVVPLSEAAHHRGPTVDVRPAASIRDRDAIVGTDRSEETLQVDLLDQHLDVAGLVLPEAQRGVFKMSFLDVIEDMSGLVLDRGVVDGFEVGELPGAVVGYDV